MMGICPLLELYAKGADYPSKIGSSDVRSLRNCGEATYTEYFEIGI